MESPTIMSHMISSNFLLGKRECYANVEFPTTTQLPKVSCEIGTGKVWTCRLIVHLQVICNYYQYIHDATTKGVYQMI